VSATLAERFHAKVDRSGGPTQCWPWLGARNSNGYGRFRHVGRKEPATTAHRIAYELAKGPLPPGTEPDHLCGNRDCQNPAHLEAVTRSENVRRGIARARAKGAALTGSNRQGRGMPAAEAADTPRIVSRELVGSGQR